MKILDQRQEQLRNFGELFDITSRKHKGNEQSTAAFNVVKDKITHTQNAILIRIESAANGLTLDDLCVEMNTTPNAISGRVSELKAMGKIYKSGTRKTRSGCSAAILKAF